MRRCVCVQKRVASEPAADCRALARFGSFSGQRFAVSVFGGREGTIRKGAVVWTTVRNGKLLSCAFFANSPAQLKALTESMRTVEFFGHPRSEVREASQFARDRCSRNSE